MSTIYTNCRGYVRLPGEDKMQPLDGGIDGYSWHAWSGFTIAYGATEQMAIGACERKLRELDRDGEQ